MTIPFTGVPLREHGPLVRRIEDAGYDSVWSAEATELDGFTPLVVAAQHSERLRLVSGIVNVFTRGPALLAQSAAALADVSSGRFVLGLGASSNVIVEQWNGIPFRRPLLKVSDTIDYMRAVLAGERGWDVAHVPGRHLHQLVDPDTVAARIVATTDRWRWPPPGSQEVRPGSGRR